MKIRTILSVFIVITSLFGCEYSKSDNYQALTGATIYDGMGNSIENGIIIISNNRIVSVGDEETIIPPNSEIIDLKNKFVMPGLIDSHVHIGSSGFFDSHGPPILRDSFPISEIVARQRFEYHRYFEAYLRSGITAIYNVGGQSWTLDLQKNQNSIENAPHFFTTGQIINANFTYPKLDPTFIKPDNEGHGREIVQTQTALGANGVKIYELNLDDEEHLKVMKAVADEVKKQKNRIVAHALNLEGAKEVVRLGAKVLVHSVIDTLVDDEFIDLIKTNNVVYTPNMCTTSGYINAWNALAGKPFEIDDPNSVIDAKTLETLQRAPQLGLSLDSVTIASNLKRWHSYNKSQNNFGVSNLVKLFNKGVLLAVGTDSGNPGTLHGLSYINELELIQNAGIPPEEIIKMATKNGAVALNQQKNIGTLEKGKIADLVIMDKNPAINISNLRSMTHVMHNGRMLSVKEDFVSRKICNKLK